MLRFLSALALASLVPAAAQADCASFIQQRTYNAWHKGPDLAFSGTLRIDSLYACGLSTCFTGFIKFGSLPWDEIIGSYSGSGVSFQRYISQGGQVQNWSGTCGVNAITGTWYYADRPSHGGPMSITL